MTEKDIKERLAILEDNSHQTLEILQDIRAYMVKTDVQEHRLTLIETHCSTCDLGSRVTEIERWANILKAAGAFCVTIASAVAGNHIWTWIKTKGLL